MPKPWRFAPHDAAAVRELSQRLRLPALVAQVLSRAGTRAVQRRRRICNRA